MWKELNPVKALIFRIIHRDNLAWALRHGLHCQNSQVKDPNYVNIGNQELIDKRHTRAVDVAPNGTLSDYVSFYFTPFSVMMFNIKTGHNGITKRRNEEIVIVVSSLRYLDKLRVPFLFTDRHAYLRAARYERDLDSLDMIDWDILQRRDFRRDNEDIEKMERYQAEALVYKHVPTDALLGVVCCNQEQASIASSLAEGQGLKLKTVAKPGWYF